MKSPKQEADALMTALLPLATAMLQQCGTFEAYGGVLQADGSVREIELPVSATLIETLRQRLRQRVERNEARAAAIVVHTTVVPPGIGHSVDAIEVIVDHRDSYCAHVFLPYQLRDGEIRFGQMFAQQCGMHIL